ncbi:MAG: TatD family hydrolase [Candidatus Omnitrophica bacterium]|nr:TatD family hydrolase [Candidatus Omnitrophota bacterium]
MIIDTHCHLDFPDFKDDLDNVIDNAKKNNVQYLINVASSLEGCYNGKELSSKYENVFYTLGIHPHDAKDVTTADYNKIKELLKDKKKIVAIGEIGLDYFRNLSPKKEQKEVFVKFLHMGKLSELPLVVHTRDSLDDTIEIMKNELGNNINAVIHCFSGGKDFLRTVLDMSMYVSFTCNVTYKKAEPLRDVLKYVPMDRLMLETDAPFLAPQALRGKRNEPANLVHLVAFLSELLKISQEEIESRTTENAIRFFGMNKRVNSSS